MLYSRIRNVTCGVNTPVLIAEASVMRTRIVVSPGITGNVFVSDNSANPASNGLMIPIGADPLVLCVDEVGDVVQRALYGTNDSSDSIIGVLEVFMTNEQCDARRKHDPAWRLYGSP